MNLYFGMLLHEVTHCEKTANEDQRFWCGEEFCHRDHKKVKSLIWKPHCTHGAVVSLYDSLGKVRAFVPKPRGPIRERRIHTFNVYEDSHWVDDPVPLHERLEARMLRVAEQATLEEKKAREAVDIMGAAVQGKRRRKKKDVRAVVTPLPDPNIGRTECRHGSVEPMTCQLCYPPLAAPSSRNCHSCMGSGQVGNFGDACLVCSCTGIISVP